MIYCSFEKNSVGQIIDLKTFYRILFYSSYKIKLCFSDMAFDVVMVIKANLEINVELNNAKLEYQFELKKAIIKYPLENHAYAKYSHLLFLIQRKFKRVLLPYSQGHAKSIQDPHGLYYVRAIQAQEHSGC